MNNFIKAFLALLMILIAGFKKVSKVSDKDTRGQEIISIVVLAVVAYAFCFCAFWLIREVLGQ